MQIEFGGMGLLPVLDIFAQWWDGSVPETFPLLVPGAGKPFRALKMGEVTRHIRLAFYNIEERDPQLESQFINTVEHPEQHQTFPAVTSEYHRLCHPTNSQYPQQEARHD